MRPLRVSRRALRRAGCWLLSLLLVATGTYGLYRLGYAVTPPRAGVPVLYSPAVRRTARYCRRAQRWRDDLAALDADLVALLDRPGDVYALAQAAQTHLDRAARLEQAIALAYPPPALVGLRDALAEAATRYLEAALALNDWLGEPTPAA